MELIRTLREKSQTKRQQTIQRMSEEAITLSDFADSLYIAFQGTPLVPIDENFTTKDIVAELTKVRQNYIKSHLAKQQ